MIIVKLTVIMIMKIIIAIIPVVLKYPVGNSHVSWASEALFSLGWQSRRDLSSNYC